MKKPNDTVNQLALCNDDQDEILEINERRDGLLDFCLTNIYEEEIEIYSDRSISCLRVNKEEVNKIFEFLKEYLNKE